MLKGNLATRPFYNERAITAAILLLVVLATLLTLFNVSELVGLSTERRRLQGVIERDEAEAARIRQEASAAERDAGTGILSQLAAASRYANDLIDQRTFSWTVFFGLIERTLPADARLVEVSPRVEQGTFRVKMTVVARDLSDVGAFIEALRQTDAFHEVAAVDQQTNDDGTYGAAIDAIYVGAGRSPARPTPDGAR